MSTFRNLFKKMDEESHWRTVADDIRAFRKGQMSVYTLKEKYPNLGITPAWRDGEEVSDVMSFTIPKECPVAVAAEIIFSTQEEPFDKGLCRYIHWVVAYRPEWERLAQVGELRYICSEHKDVTFYHVSVRGDEIEIRDCIKRGDCGDEDGYGIEPDTWLVGRLNSKGEWICPFYIEE